MGARADEIVGALGFVFIAVRERVRARAPEIPRARLRRGGGAHDLRGRQSPCPRIIARRRKACAGTLDAARSPMLCQEIMHRRICSVRETDDVALAARTMRDEDVGFLPVLDSDDSVIGVVTDRDMVVRACIGPVDPRQILVGAVMSRDVVACRPTDSVEVAEGKMRARRITRLVVIDSDGTLVGVISLSDIAQYDAPGRVGRTLQAIAERKYAF
jgi:CBS domain-containing protein